MSVLGILTVSVIILFLLGVPIFASLAISSSLAILLTDVYPLAVIHNTLFSGLNLFPLLAIPCFIVAGTLMEYGNITEDIINVVKMVVGRLPGGIGITTIGACAFFAAITGSGASTVAAVGGILCAAMTRNGYSPEYAGAVASTGGTLGILIPPSNPMIIYAIIGNLSVTGMFTAGFIPGFLVSFALCFTAYFLAKRAGFKGDDSMPPFQLKEFVKTCFRAFFSLATVVIILGSIYAGICTPVEASVVAVVWALFVGTVIKRSLKPKHIYKALIDGAVICGTILIIVGTSTLFGKILTYEKAPEHLAEFILGISSNPYIFMIMIIILMYFLGMFMETLAVIILVAPVLLPVVYKLGIDPIHFGILLVMTTQIGLMTPPLGVNLFVASRLTGVSVERLAVSVLPYIAALTIIILLVAFIPPIATWLPNLLGYGV